MGAVTVLTPPPPVFSFRRTWTVAAPVAAVHAALVDLERYPEWWPQVLAVAKLGADDARVLCRSTLPYTLDLVLHAVHRERRLLETGISGDLHGSVRWRLTAIEGGTRMDFEQDVAVRGRRLGLASYLVAPVLRWNHDRMMAGCLAGLRALLAARTAPTPH